MGDSFTNLLLIMLMGLIGYIGKVLFEKLEAFAAKIEAIVIADVSTGKDVQQLQKDIENHEDRISDLENK